MVLTLAVALAGAAVMLATARTFNRVFSCLDSVAYGWPFPWETIGSHHSGPGLWHPADYWFYNFSVLLAASFFIGRCVQGRSVAAPTLTVIAMLTISPLIAVTFWVGCTPPVRSQLRDPITVASYVFVSIRLLWVTYLPALVIVPLLMSRVSTRRTFQQLSLARLLTRAVAIGAVGGACVIVPRTVLALFDSTEHPPSWLLALGACAVSGAVTLPLVCLFYRGRELRAEPNASNGGPAMPFGNSVAVGGPPSVS